jgi:hypothetical protein
MGTDFVVKLSFIEAECLDHLIQEHAASVGERYPSIQFDHEIEHFRRRMATALLEKKLEHAKFMEGN